MWTKKTIPLLLFIALTVLPHAISPILLTSEKKQPKVTWSLENFKKKLCSPPSQPRSDVVNLFITKLEDFQDPIELGDWLWSTPIIKIEKCIHQLELCKTDLIRTKSKTKDTGSAHNISLRIQDIERMVNGLNRILYYIDMVAALRSDINNMLTAIRKIHSLHPDRKQFPPGPDFDGYWVIIKRIADFGAKKEPVVHYSTLRKYINALDRLESKKQIVCSHLKQLKRIDLDRIQKDFKYFTWTETWLSIKKIVALLQEPSVDKLCR